MYHQEPDLYGVGSNPTPATLKTNLNQSKQHFFLGLFYSPTVWHYTPRDDKIRGNPVTGWPKGADKWRV